MSFWTNKSLKFIKMMSFNVTTNFIEEISLWSSNNLWATQDIFIYTAVDEITKTVRELIITSKLHCGAIISTFFPCSLLETRNKVLVSHKVTSFVTKRHITCRPRHYFRKMIKCWTSDRLFSFYDGIELNHNTRFGRDNLCWCSCKFSSSVWLRDTIQLQVCQWN